MEERVKFKMIADEQLIAREESLNLTECFETRIADSNSNNLASEQEIN